MDEDLYGEDTKLQALMHSANVIVNDLVTMSHQTSYNYI